MLHATNRLDVTAPAGTGREVRRAWNPAVGYAAAPEQRPPPPAQLLADGTVLVKLWAPTEGPCRSDPGGGGGGPDGRTLSLHKVVWD